MEQPSLGLRSDCVLLFLGTQTGVLLSENVYIKRHTTDQQVILVYRGVGFACAVCSDPLMCDFLSRARKIFLCNFGKFLHSQAQLFEDRLTLTWG